MRSTRVGDVLRGLLVLLAGTLAANGASGGAAPAIEAVLVVQGLSAPMMLTAPKGDTRLFVAERAGRIEIVQNGVERSQPFLDLQSRVATDGEGGLLGLAFPPDYASSGRFYVYYTTCDTTATNGAACTAGGKAGAFHSVVSRLHTSADPNVADPASEEILLVVAQPYTNHKGGTIAFGPKDGLLYLGLGDGGSANDPLNNAQNPASLLGKLLRLDVSGKGSYTIPASNPFVGSANARGEVWSLGLRNPFRFAFDRSTGDRWIGDVGQDSREEVDVEGAGSPGGLNYGWRVMEGSRCNIPAPSLPCDSPSFTAPFFEYAHPDVPDTTPPAGLTGCAIIGGTVYRGVIPGVQGLYFFGDYCGGLYTLDPATRAVSDVTLPLIQASRTQELSSLSEDGFGELYFTNLGGTIYRLHSTLPDRDGDGVPDVADNCIDEPNGPLLPDAGGNVQLDADRDGYGNACDADFNEDGIVNFVDLARMKSAFLSGNPVADLNGDRAVNFGDLAIMKRFFFQKPGPSGLACAGTVPCSAPAH